MKKISIIGVGGRTGTMFAKELEPFAEITGVAREEEVSSVKAGKILIKRKKENPEVFRGHTVKDVDFKEQAPPDFMFITTKNPVSPPIKFYYQDFKGEEKIPALLLSQNGISALEEAQKTLKEIFGPDYEKIRIFRIILFNPIDRETDGGRILIKYSLPIRIAFAQAFGPSYSEDLTEIFRQANFEFKQFPQKEARNLEFSKLFLNLFGMAAAVQGLSVKEGFKNTCIFREEAEAIKEYVRTVKTAGGKFLSLPGYPVNFLANIFDWLPVKILLPFRNLLASVISQGREGKTKDLDEIDYYNGAVVEMAGKLNISVPCNEKIKKRAFRKV